MFRLSLILSSAILAASCTSPGSQPAIATATAPAGQPENQFAGRWTGQTARGGSVAFNIPSSGNPTYAFRGQNVPVSSARISNGVMVLTVGSGNGHVTLTPQSDGSLAYAYAFQGQTTTATLRKS